MTETTAPRGAVVVGVEGSESDEQPLQVAVAHARRHHRPLHVLHATAIGIVPWTPERLAAQRAITAAWVERARVLAPDLSLSSSTVVDDQSAALVASSRDASVVVMGAGRLGRVGSIVLGATTAKVASHAQCPVMVVPDAWTGAGAGADAGAGGGAGAGAGTEVGPGTAPPVVVGVDDDTYSVPALDWAFAEASARNAPLLALHAWWWDEPSPLSSANDLQEEWQLVADSQRVLLSEMVAGRRERYPDVEVRTELTRGDTTAVLEQASDDAQLLVVGTRGRGGFSGLLLGSVSARALHHSRCPVVVVPSTPRGSSA